MPESCLVGVDVGGTFTDAVLYSPGLGRLVTAKVPTTVPDASEGIVESVRAVCARAEQRVEDIAVFLHGTTAATNALLEHRGAPTGMITSSGYRDITHIGRHQRPQNYSVMQEIPWQDRALVPRTHRKTVDERISAQGDVLVPLDEDGVLLAASELVDDGVQSIVVAFLNSYRNPAHERRAAALISAEYSELFVTASSDVVAQFREFERFTTAAISGFVGPLVARYVRNVVVALRHEGLRSSLLLMMSNGGATTPEDAARTPVNLLLSGPAAGVLGARWAGDVASSLPAVTFDMGGTSTDIGLVTATGVSEASSRDTWVAGFPVLVPMLDVLTIGAGGGSVAYVDAGGALQVGPRSAGAVPGPACYGKGGREATVTDAHAVLGRLDPNRLLGGSLAIDVSAAQEAVGAIARTLGLSIHDTAEGIIRIANNNMAAAIRAQTIQRGIDPRGLTLIAFGGAGPLHAAELADMLGVTRVLIPPAPGNTSALGLLTSSLTYYAVGTVFQRAGECNIDALASLLAEQRTRLMSQLKQSGVDESEAVYSVSMDCRYLGQGYELRIPIPGGEFSESTLERLAGDFHAAHAREYGHNFPNNSVEYVNLRSSLASPPPHLASIRQIRGAPPPDSSERRGSAWFYVDKELVEITVHYMDREFLGEGEMVPGAIVLCQEDSTLVVPPGWVCAPVPGGSLQLTKKGADE